LLLAAPLLLAACGGSNEGGSGAAPADAVKINVTISDAGCAPASITAKPGKTTFVVKNAGSSKVDEFYVLDGTKILGEVEHVIQGVTKNLTLTLKEGTFKTRCPNGETAEYGELIVTAA
jgi:iron uptake system component EfeO